jgi:thioredoxin-like negative regulator of GroEL
LIKVDVDKNAEASAKYGIQAMPTFKVLDKQGV